MTSAKPRSICSKVSTPATKTVRGSAIERAICHPGGDVGYPVFTEFGADLLKILRKAGFEAAEHFGPATEDDLAQVYVCRKPDCEPIDIMEP